MKIILKPTLDSSKLASASPTSNPIILMKQQSRFRVARRTIMMHRKGVSNTSMERKRVSKMYLDLIVFIVSRDFLEWRTFYKRRLYHIVSFIPVTLQSKLSASINFLKVRTCGP